MNIRNLNKRIAREVHPNEIDEREIEISRDVGSSDYPGLRRETRRQVDYLHALLVQHIPDDFNFYFALGEAGTRLHIEYDDGPMGQFSFSIPTKIDARFFAELPDTDWDEVRGSLLAHISAQDRAAEEAVNHPVRIQPASETQREYFGHLLPFLEESKASGHAFAALAVRHDEDYTEPEFETITPKDRQTLVFDVADLMTVGFRIIAVILEGSPITPSEIDAIKLEALDCLGPISRAKAEGRFADAFAAIMEGGSQQQR